MRRLLDSKHVLIDQDAARRLVRLTRTDASMDSPEEMSAVLTSIVEATRRLDKRKLRMLVDLRRAPMRTGTSFDPRLRELQKTMDGYQRCAVLVRTAVGTLQVARISRETGLEHGVFHDENEALAFLDGG